MRGETVNGLAMLWVSYVDARKRPETVSPVKFCLEAGEVEVSRPSTGEALAGKMRRIRPQSRLPYKDVLSTETGQIRHFQGMYRYRTLQILLHKNELRSGSRRFEDSHHSHDST